MNKKTLLVFAGIFIFLYILNYLTPMSFGDDYVYSFMWQGEVMSKPIPADAARISSWKDLFASQWLHYFTWGGRAIAHVLIQLFLWIGKNVFNFFNTCICTILIAEIYFCINKGNVKLFFEAKEVFLIFVALWAFTPAFSQVFFWVGGSLNYVWTTAFLLAFLIPYIRKYYTFSQEEINKKINAFSIFFIGILAGWSNENTICWIILFLSLFLFTRRHELDSNKDIWMYTGLAGLIIGYALLMLAPGNANRFYLEYGHTASFINRTSLVENLKMAVLIFFIYHVVMWYYCLRSFWSLKQKKVISLVLKEEIFLVKILCIIAFGMCIIMLFSPEFPPRSAFQSTVFLIIACGIFMRLQEEYQVELIRENAKRFMLYVGCFYFFITSSVTLYCFYNMQMQFQNLMSVVQQTRINAEDNVLIVKPFKEPKNAFFWSGMHTITYELSEKVDFWSNVAFSKYHNIKGIRMIKEDKEVVK